MPWGEGGLGWGGGEGSHVKGPGMLVGARPILDRHLGLALFD